MKIFIQIHLNVAAKVLKMDFDKKLYNLLEYYHNALYIPMETESFSFLSVSVTFYLCPSILCTATIPITGNLRPYGLPAC